MPLIEGLGDFGHWHWHGLQSPQLGKTQGLESPAGIWRSQRITGTTPPYNTRYLWTACFELAYRYK